MLECFQQHMTSSQAWNQHRSAAFAIMIQTRTFLLFTFVFFVFCFVVVFGQTTSPETSKFHPYYCMLTSFLTVDIVKQWVALQSIWIEFWASTNFTQSVQNAFIMTKCSLCIQLARKRSQCFCSSFVWHNGIELIVQHIVCFLEIVTF